MQKPSLTSSDLEAGEAVPEKEKKVTHLVSIKTGQAMTIQNTDRVDSYHGAALNCIMHHPGFDPVCLNRWFLDTAYLQYRQQYGGRGQNASPNKKYRHTAYRRLTRWCWGHLGHMVRVPLSAQGSLHVQTEHVLFVSSRRPFHLKTVFI
ncbi:uncharacterized protein LOC110990633 [Acanthaster planci]|uniref:Uncharacterized protein LOC110990633 n=1 Tax=Acanthaster planci TaxID=133434 RepID=A0A8B8A0X5_ACAPL|nr:uncharacterized protein LOC110990633 [Acanthaster planci]